jgi:Tfp pilus assembly protein PilO
MGEKLNLVLIIALFLLIVGLSYYFYSNSTIEKKVEKTIIEN